MPTVVWKCEWCHPSTKVEEYPEGSTIRYCPKCSIRTWHWSSFSNIDTEPSDGEEDNG